MTDYENNTPFRPGYPFSGPECPICVALNNWCFKDSEKFDFLNRSQLGGMVINDLHENWLYLTADSWDRLTDKYIGGVFHGRCSKPEISRTSKSTRL